MLSWLVKWRKNATERSDVVPKNVVEQVFFIFRVAAVAILASALFVGRWVFARCQLSVLVSAGAAT